MVHATSPWGDIVRGSGAVYFEVICVLLIIYALGQRLKTRVRESVRSKLDSGDAFALTANVLTNGDGIQSVPVSSIRQGQHVVVYPGQMIPVDGTIVSGTAVPQVEMAKDTAWSIADVKAIIASVERTSDHPFAKALQGLAESDSRFGVRDVRLLAGRGIAANVFDLEASQTIAVEIVRSATSCQAVNVARLDVLFDSQRVAQAELSESIPSELTEMFTKLRKQEIKTVVLSGDAQSRADAISADVSRGMMTSVQKSDYVKKLKYDHKVLFVGDGFNDAQAMATADVSVAAAWGTDFAAEPPTSFGRGEISCPSSMH